MASGANRRLVHLDGFRALAVTMVIAYHYGFRFRDYYPYRATIDALAYGHLGVQLFFLISGFVIVLSLRRESTVHEFLGRRVARLLPPMIVCSLLTFAMMWAISDPFALARRQGIGAFLPSWTFTDPRLWRRLLGDVDYIDGAYWSLFVEVRFYLLCALIHWWRKGGTWIYLGLICAVSTIAYQVALHGHHAGLASLITLFFFPSYFPLFCGGAIFLELYRDRTRWPLLGLIALTYVVACLYVEDAVEAVMIAGFYLLFVAMIYWPGALRLFALRPVARIGLMSYSIYLLHQNIGVALITTQLGGSSLFNIALVIAVLALIGVLAAGVFWALESRAHWIYDRFAALLPSRRASDPA